MLLIRPDSREGDDVIPVRAGGVIGTSSNRRKCQIAHFNPTLQINDLRGNVPTRVNKLRDGHYDAILAAAAGINRLELDLSDLEVVLLDAEQFLPAPAQGTLGLQIRDDDRAVDDIISRLGSAEAMTEANLERGLLKKFDSGCSLPLGVCSSLSDGNYRLKAILGTRDADEWGVMKRVEVFGCDVATVIDQAYRELIEN
jgi:hydroxymethylbilane synthase